jgi:hypothetical protein
MDTSTSVFPSDEAGKVAGVYVASTPSRWARSVFKVGVTSDLRERLHHSAYRTTAEEPWRYVLTYELPPELRYAVETQILQMVDGLRVTVPGHPKKKELVQMPLDVLESVLVKAVGDHGLDPLFVRRWPTYERAPSRALASSTDSIASEDVSSNDEVPQKTLDPEIGEYIAIRPHKVTASTWPYWVGQVKKTGVDVDGEPGVYVSWRHVDVRGGCCVFTRPNYGHVCMSDVLAVFKKPVGRFKRVPPDAHREALERLL